jgi:hypothetical protein
MDFHQLLAKMQELDKPAVEQSTSEECGMPPPGMPPMGSMGKPDIPPPSMSVNINAQGLDNIEDMMKLFTKVNPDMMPIDKPSMPPMPSLGMPPSIMSIKPELPPLKMLPDMDADNDDKPGGEMDLPPDHDKDHMMIKTLDKDDDGDHDMDDHEKERKDKDEAYMNEPDEDEKSIDYMNNKLSGGMNRPKDTFPKVADADNPMQKKKFESGDLRAQIRAELLQRLAEAKGVK